MIQNKKRFLGNIAIIAFATIMFACGNNGKAKLTQGEEATHEESHIATLTDEQIRTVGIEVGKIEMRSMNASIRASGTLRVPNNYKADITTLYGGVVTSLTVHINDNVRKGQTVALIANPQFIQLQEEYITLESKITFAQQELQRQQQLTEGNAGTGRNLQSATAELNSLRTRRQSIQKQLQIMGIDPSSVSDGNIREALPLRSPIGGTVSQIFAKIGSYVDVAIPVMEVVDNGALHLDLEVFEQDLPKVKVGQSIDFTLTNNPTTHYKGKVFSIGASFENESKTISLHCEVFGDKSGLIDGMNITGTIGLDNVVLPAVPNEAVVESEGKYYVFVELSSCEDSDDSHKHDMRFERIEVYRGAANMGYVAVTAVKPLPQDARIATKGAFFINATLVDGNGHSH